MPRARATASSATPGGTGAGLTERSRMWFWWSLAITPQWVKAPSIPRAPTTETSRSKSMKPSSTASSVATSRHAAAASPAVSITACPLPS